MKKLFRVPKRLVLSVLTLVCVLAVGSTVAYLHATDASLRNTFALATIDTEIKETETEGNKTVTIVNKAGNSDAYVRARVLVSGLPETNVKVLAQTPQSLDPDTLYLIMEHGDKWQQENGSQNSNWYYYCGVLAAGNETESLLSKVVFGKNLEEKLESITVTITHESVLAQPADQNTPAGIKDVFDKANTPVT